MKLMNIEELMECVFAIHGLEKYIPRSVIKSYIIPFAIEKPHLYCKKCGKILYFGAKCAPIPSTWHISWTFGASRQMDRRFASKDTALPYTAPPYLRSTDQTIISCTECFNYFFKKK